MGKAHEALVFADTIDAKGLIAVLVRATGHKKLTINVLSVLANWRKIKPLVILKRNNLPSESFLAKVHLNVMRKDQLQQNSWSNDCEKC